MNTLRSKSPCGHRGVSTNGYCLWCEDARILRAARAALAPELNRPIIESVADRIIEELKAKA
jgi:hypothetical protein